MGFIVDYKSPAELKKLGMEDYEKALAVAVKVGLQKRSKCADIRHYEEHKAFRLR